MERIAERLVWRHPLHRHTINMLPADHKPQHIDRHSKTPDKRKKETDKQQQRNRQ